MRDNTSGALTAQTSSRLYECAQRTPSSIWLVQMQKHAQGSDARRKAALFVRCDASRSFWSASVETDVADVGKFAPDVAIKWRIPAMPGPCSLRAVRFEDGTEWSAPPLPIASPPPVAIVTARHFEAEFSFVDQLEQHGCDKRFGVAVDSNVVRSRFAFRNSVEPSSLRPRLRRHSIAKSSQREVPNMPISRMNRFLDSSSAIRVPHTSYRSESPRRPSYKLLIRQLIECHINLRSMLLAS